MNMQEVITLKTGTQPVLAPPTDADPNLTSSEHQRLGEEIRQLWATHMEAKATAKRAKAELKDIRKRLMEPLAQMKALVARPRRNGGWSSFTQSAGLTRAEADGLVRRYRKTVKPQGACSIGTVNATVTIEGNSSAAVAGDCPEAAVEMPAVSVPENAALPTLGEASGVIEEPEVETAAMPTETGISAAPGRHRQRECGVAERRRE